MKCLLLSICLFVILPLTTNASILQGEGVLLKQQLCKGWKYKKCRIMGVDYTPKREEANDHFQFQSDMTFTLIEEGVEKSGTWKIINEETKLLALQFNNGTSKQLKIERLDRETLVYTIIADWEYDVTIYMQARPQDPQIQANGLLHFGNHPTQGISLHSLLFP